MQRPRLHWQSWNPQWRQRSAPEGQVTSKQGNVQHISHTTCIILRHRTRGKVGAGGAKWMYCFYPKFLMYCRSHICDRCEDVIVRVCCNENSYHTRPPQLFKLACDVACAFASPHRRHRIVDYRVHPQPNDGTLVALFAAMHMHQSVHQ